MEPLIIFGIFVVIAVAVRLAADGMDRDRIRQHVEGGGGKVLSIQWRLFGPGWFGTQYARLYAVRYLDREGNTHQAMCKTSMLAGVYWTDDRIVRYAPHTASPAERQAQELEQENRRLRAELERLRGHE